MLAQRLRRWPNIETPLFQRVVFAGKEEVTIIKHRGVPSHFKDQQQ